MNARVVPQLLALCGLGALLLGGGSGVSVVGVLNVLAVGSLLAVGWLVVHHYRYPLTRTHRSLLAMLLLPYLALTGGWWLIPADLAWLAIEILEPVVHRQRHQI